MMKHDSHRSAGWQLLLTMGFPTRHYTPPQQDCGVFGKTQSFVVELHTLETGFTFFLLLNRKSNNFPLDDHVVFFSLVSARAPCQLTHSAVSEKRWRAFDSSLSNSRLEKIQSEQLRKHSFSTLGSLLTLRPSSNGPKRRRGSETAPKNKPQASSDFSSTHTFRSTTKRESKKRRDMSSKNRNTFNFLPLLVQFTLMDSISPSITSYMSTFKQIQSSFIHFLLVVHSFVAFRRMQVSQLQNKPPSVWPSLPFLVRVAPSLISSPHTQFLFISISI